MQASLVGKKGVGTIPHALIAAYKGDTVKATLKFEKAGSLDVTFNVSGLGATAR